MPLVACQLAREVPTAAWQERAEAHSAAALPTPFPCLCPCLPCFWLQGDWIFFLETVSFLGIESTVLHSSFLAPPKDCDATEPAAVMSWVEAAQTLGRDKLSMVGHTARRTRVFLSRFSCMASTSKAPWHRRSLLMKSVQ